MQLSPEDLERRLFQAERQIKALSEAQQRTQSADFIQMNYPGTANTPLTALRVYIQPIFPNVEIQAAAIVFQARPDSSGGGGASRLQVGLYQAQVPDQMPPFTQDQFSWDPATSFSPNALTWRLLTQSNVAFQTGGSFARVRWLLPQTYTLRPGGPILGLGITTTNANTTVWGEQTPNHSSMVGSSELLTSIGQLPTQVRGYILNLTSAMALTIYSKRGMRAIGG